MWDQTQVVSIKMINTDTARLLIFNLFQYKLSILTGRVHQSLPHTHMASDLLSSFHGVQTNLIETNRNVNNNLIKVFTMKISLQRGPKVVSVEWTTLT